MEISSIHCLSQTVRAIELNFLEKAQPPPYVTCHVLHVMFHMSCVTCHVSHVMCHRSCVTCHVSHVMCHMSCVTCHVSHVICYMSHVICNFFFFLYFIFLEKMLSQRRFGYQRGPLRLVFFCVLIFCLFSDFTKQLFLEISFATSLLLMMGELAGGGSVCGCGCCCYRQVTRDMWQSTIRGVRLSVCFFYNLFQTFCLPLAMFLLVLVLLSPSVKRFGVLCMQDYFLFYFVSISWDFTGLLTSQKKLLFVTYLFSQIHLILQTYSYLGPVPYNHIVSL